jgi:mannose-6-phosphate isomerase class I
LQIFDYTPRSVRQVAADYRITPQVVSSTEERLIGPAQTDCFSISRLTVRDGLELSPVDRLRLGVVAGGQGAITVGGTNLSLSPGSHFLLAAGAPPGALSATSQEPLSLLFISPGADE